MKKILAILAVCAVLVFVGFSDTDNTSIGTSKTIIYDDAVTTTNDTLVSSWINIGNSDQVSFYIAVDDTARVWYYTDYRYGTETEVTLAVDSLITTGEALTGEGKGVVLRGYGASAITNLIPGANAVRVRAYWKTGSETSIKVHVGLNY